VCFTGGEPALFPDRLVELMGLFKKKVDDAFCYVLTNGILFSDFDIAKKISLAAPLKTTFCVSLHADVAQVHETMTGAKGSFGKVVKGIHNLAKLRQAVEIRPVITRLNYTRLDSMAEYIYRNFPFAAHVAFMGMEIKGEAETHYDEIWIDPFDYSQALSEAVWDLHRRGMNVSIYNIPLCLLPKESWRFARKSISDWKNDYLGVCNDCTVRDRCCGVFTTSGGNQSPHIKPLDEKENR
jgi:His-Xaa-Ser system radical SAM maturase HxsC